MNKLFSILRYALFASALVLASCSDDDEGGSGAEGETKYVFLNAAEKWDEGYFTTFDDFPSGIVPPLESSSLQVNSSFGFRTYKNWIFTRTNAAGDEGLQKFTVNADGTLKAEGFIIDAAQFLVVNETTGFYSDEKRGAMKIQTFDPSTMSRTGEIDLSELRDETISEYQVVGKHTLAAKEGKLYAGINYTPLNTAGYGGDLIDHVEFAVIDIATKKLDKVIKYDDGVINSIGWGSSGNKMWSVGDDGALYFYSTGLTNGFSKSKVIRIKAGATTFDEAWTVDAANIGLKKNTSIAMALVKKGKMYLELASEDLDPAFANLQSFIFDYYVVDLASGTATRISGMPKHHYAYANEQAITEIDGDVYFWVRNIDEGIDGYYKLGSDGVSATQSFNVDHDGFTWGFAKVAP
ncbi:hypothetical protein WBG78_27065 [Chryseolinea sp. T2]|uniref:hypothetical protein n=1 Tax=Chryseolinea sp. T2 TaxID=3129255 RepID=UPI003076DDF4